MHRDFGIVCTKKIFLENRTWFFPGGMLYYSYTDVSGMGMVAICLNGHLPDQSSGRKK
tara:strand:+ start:390 stop:563 length:174 start_codon:yes stop_codon:yes gene_type:complete